MKLTRGDKVIGVKVGKLAPIELNNEDTCLSACMCTVCTIFIIIIIFF